MPDRTAANATPTVSHHVIRATALPDMTLLAAMGPIAPNGEVALVFKSGARAAAFASTPDFQITSETQIGGGLILRGRAKTDKADIALPLPGLACRAPLLQPQPARFAGKRTALALRGTEDAPTIRDWLAFHVDTQGLQAALILNRTPPEGGAALAEALAGLAPPGLDHLAVVSFDTPLGRATDGDSALPHYAPDAPGKDRMARPAPSPWAAPLAEPVVVELLRHLFLDAARGVMNIDLSDLLPHLPDGTVFEQAEAAPGGVVPLIGHRIYPWGLRKGAVAGYGDHICRLVEGPPAHPRWCVAPAQLPADTLWRYLRIDGVPAPQAAPLPFLRCMALRHPGVPPAKLAPKASLVEDPALHALARSAFDARPRTPPRPALAPRPERIPGRTGIVTCMKNEGPFILEWIAYHRAIGVDDFLIYSNDCTDGTDHLLDLLQRKGLLQHRDNPYRATGKRPQHAALDAAGHEPLVHALDWVIGIDVDEFINIHVGDGRLSDLFAATGDANLISMTWRLFGNADVTGFEDRFITEQFTRCARALTRVPHQAWGFKTAFRPLGIFRKMGVHRPKGLQPHLADKINWVNGSGQPMPRKSYRAAWRSTLSTVGYDLVTLNHYALRSAESFLVKRDRGRVNHVERDQGLAYWFRMNHNTEDDHTIARRLPAARAEYDRLMADPEIAAAHAACVTAHRAKIAALLQTETYRDFFTEITSDRLRALSRMLPHFGAQVFLNGPDVIPDAVLGYADDPKFFFTGKDAPKTP
ncbi:glycosyltransferase family 2 protein [Roseobacter sp. A03A-229]